MKGKKIKGKRKRIIISKRGERERVIKKEE